MLSFAYVLTTDITVMFYLKIYKRLKCREMWLFLETLIWLEDISYEQRMELWGGCFKTWFYYSDSNINSAISMSDHATF